MQNFFCYDLYPNSFSKVDSLSISFILLVCVENKRRKSKHRNFQVLLFLFKAIECIVFVTDFFNSATTYKRYGTRQEKNGLQFMEDFFLIFLRGVCCADWRRIHEFVTEIDLAVTRHAPPVLESSSPRANQYGEFLFYVNVSIKALTCKVRGQ